MKIQAQIAEKWHKIASEEIQVFLFVHHHDKDRNIHGIEGHNRKLRTIKAKRAKTRRAGTKLAPKK